VELQLALICIRYAILVEKSFLRSITELIQTVPNYGKVLIPISNPDPAHFDASDDTARTNENIVEREIAVRDDRIGNQGQQVLQCFPYLFGCPALAFLVKIVRFDPARANARQLQLQPVGMIAVEGVAIYGDRVQAAEKCS